MKQCNSRKCGGGLEWIFTTKYSTFSSKTCSAESGGDVLSNWDLTRAHPQRHHLVWMRFKTCRGGDGGGLKKSMITWRLYIVRLLCKWDFNQKKNCYNTFNHSLGKKQKGQSSWSSVVLYIRYWQPNQPNSFNGNQDCGEIVPKSPGVGEWNDDGCFAEQQWICENWDHNESHSYWWSVALDHDSNVYLQCWSLVIFYICLLSTNPMKRPKHTL